MPSPANLKACLLTLADFGEKKNLKTPNSLAMLAALKQIDPQVLALCRDYAHFDERAKTIMPLGNVLPRAFSLGARWNSKLFGRNNLCRLMDLFARRRLPKTDLLMVYPLYFDGTCRKARSQGALVVAVDAGSRRPSILPSPDRPRPSLNYRAIQEADYIITFSEMARSKYIELNLKPPEKVFAVPTGTDTRHFTPAPRQDKTFRVLAVGHYNKDKGFQFLMEAWEKLQLPDSELMIIGRPSGDMAPVVEGFRKKLSHFKTTITKDPRPFYQNANLLVHPSRSEGSARVIFEAMACDLPVVCTPNSGSVVEDGVDGFLIPPDSPESIREKIKYLYNHPERASEMGKKAGAKVREQYDWKHFQERLYAVLCRIIEQERGGSGTG